MEHCNSHAQQWIVLPASPWTQAHDELHKFCLLVCVIVSFSLPFVVERFVFFCVTDEVWSPEDVSMHNNNLSLSTYIRASCMPVCATE